MTWTKGNKQGEWEVSEYWQGGITEPVYLVGSPNHARVNGYANAKLISLAPRMANAVIKLANGSLKKEEIGEVNNLVKELEKLKAAE